MKSVIKEVKRGKYLPMRVVFLFSLTLCLTPAAQAQTEAITVPYSMSFEDSEAQELTNWILNPGSGADTLPEKWIVGEGTHSDGRKAMYISNNGEDCQFGVATLVQYAYRDILLPKGTYECSFDWRCVGTTGSALYAGVFDRETIKNLMVGNGRAEIPSQILTGCSLRDMRGNSRWQHSDFRISANGSRVLRIYFIWMNKNADQDLVVPIGACVDNIQITYADCKKPTDMTAEIVGDSLVVTWKGTSEKYIVEYRKNGRDKWNISTAIEEEVYYIENLDEGAYDVRVRGICNGVNSSAYTYVNSVLVYYPDRHCIDYVHLEDNPALTATYGKFTSPDANVGIIDFGSDDKFSRHTVNIVPDVYDPRTGNRLSTIAPNSLASIRLGNWNTGSEAESITFEYEVNEESAILLMHYAIVLEDPNHSPNEQPHFTLEIIDQWGDLIEPTCGYADFYADITRQENGWHAASSNVSWKEWTTIGLNLTERMGEMIRVRLTTRDCSVGGHYGYAYFSLDCVAARISGTSCGNEAALTIAAPEGFDYEWFDKYDNPVSESMLVNNGQTLAVPSWDTTTYRCHLSYVEEASCGFDLYSSAKPRFPVASFDWAYEPSKCQNRVRFINKSHIMTNFDNHVEYHYDQPCDEYEWDYGFDMVGSERNPVVIFPSEGGTFDVTLYSYIAEGRCADDTTITITLPEIGDKFVQKDTTICEGSYVIFGPQYIAIPGEFENVWQTSVGCDSTVTLTVTVNPQSEVRLPDTTVCAEVPLCIDGECYKLHESGEFVRFRTNKYGCDSTIWINVTMLDSILPELTIREMSDTPNSGAIFIDGTGFEYYTVNGGAPQTADSISGLNGGSFTLEFFNDFGCSVIQEAMVSVCMPGWVYQRWDNVLSLKNAETLEVDSTAHIFTDYQWFKNNEPIEGANLSYLYLENGFESGATYHLEMTRVSNGEKMVTCPFRPSVVDDEPMVVYVYPSPVKRGGTLTIKVNAAATARFVSILGETVIALDLNEGENTVTADIPAGIYLVQVTIGGKTHVCRISVIE